MKIFKKIYKKFGEKWGLKRKKVKGEKDNSREKLEQDLAQKHTNRMFMQCHVQIHGLFFSLKFYKNINIVMCMLGDSLLLSFFLLFHKFWMIIKCVISCLRRHVNILTIVKLSITYLMCERELKGIYQALNDKIKGHI